MTIERRSAPAHPEVIGVFGANGFIGRALVQRLARDGRRVVAFGRAFPGDFWGTLGVETRVIEFADVIATHAGMQDITAAVLLVNNSGPGLGNARIVSDLAANVLPQVGFIESCQLVGVSRLVFISSGGTVYGEPRATPIDESHPTRPINSYGLTKLVVEQYLDMMLRGSATSYVTLRVSNPFGPGQVFKKGQGLIASIMQCLRHGNPVTVFGNGGALRDYLFIDDLQDAIVAALDTDLANETFNIGSGVGRSVVDVIGAIEAILGRTLDTRSTPDRATDAKANVLDCGKAARLLGWRATTPFEIGLRRTLLPRRDGPAAAGPAP